MIISQNTAEEVITASGIEQYAHQPASINKLDGTLEISLSTMSSLTQSGTKFLNRPSLNVFHWNVQCIKNKMDTVEYYLEELDVDVACIVETWLEPSEVELYNFSNYKTADSYSRPNRKHGGSAIYVKQKVCCKPITAVNKMS